MSNESSNEHSPLFKNGIEAIENGLEDFDSGKPSRVSSAIRNVAAGVLLILKEKLRRLSEGQAEFLLSKNIETKWEAQPDGSFKGVPIASGKQTVDTEELKKRLESQGVKLTRWSEVKQLVEIRNYYEHHAPNVTTEAAREATSNATAVLEEFLRTSLDTRAELVFSKSTWKRMLEIGALNEQVEDECREARASVEMGTDSATEFVREMPCGKCGSSLVTADADGDFLCRACGYNESCEAFIAVALAYSLSGEAYDAFKDGGPAPLEWCSTCSNHTFLVYEDECLLCGGGRPDEVCMRCGNSIPASEQGNRGLCSWCAHMSAKDD